VKLIKKYKVRVFIPAVYEVAAESEDQAKKEAVEIFKAENNTSIDPEVESSEPDPAVWLKPKVYKGKWMDEEEDEYLS
jgi:hypothetical protein